MSENKEKVTSDLTNATPFEPPFGLRNAHVQTVFSNQGPRKVNRNRRFNTYIASQTELILDGGEGVRLQGYHNLAREIRSRHLVILLHGWEGSHESTYMKSMAGTLLNEGIDTFRLNMRDHGDSHHLNEGVFNSTLVEEVMNAIADLQSKLDYQEYSLIGFSLGGNFSLRVAAHAHEKPLSLNRVIAFCPVVHAAQSNRVLNERRNLLYGKYFVRKWRRSLRKKLEHWPEYEFGSQLSSLKTLDEMNKAFIPQYTEFKEIDAYFDAYAIDGATMADTICPCYLHFSKDDMIIPVEGVGLLADNPDLHVTVTERGGHCGFLMNWRGDSWQDLRALEIINQA